MLCFLLHFSATNSSAFVKFSHFSDQTIAQIVAMAPEMPLIAVMLFCILRLQSYLVLKL